MHRITGRGSCTNHEEHALIPWLRALGTENLNSPSSHGESMALLGSCPWHFNWPLGPYPWVSLLRHFKLAERHMSLCCWEGCWYRQSSSSWRCPGKRLCTRNEINMRKCDRNKLLGVIRSCYSKLTAQKHHGFLRNWQRHKRKCRLLIPHTKGWGSHCCRKLFRPIPKCMFLGTTRTSTCK